MKFTKQLALAFLLSALTTISAYTQQIPSPKEQPLYTLIEQYAQAREAKDTVLLNQILTNNIDQLVSSGEWRRGLNIALEGMLRSSTSNPGDRTLAIDQIRFLTKETAVVDARYEIRNADGTLRKMWSTFIAVYEGKRWKITAIRNMLPTG